MGRPPPPKCLQNTLIFQFLSRILILGGGASTPFGLRPSHVTKQKQVSGIRAMSGIRQIPLYKKGSFHAKGRSPPKATPISKFCLKTEKSGCFGDIFGWADTSLGPGGRPKKIVCRFRRRLRRPPKTQTRAHARAQLKKSQWIVAIGVEKVSEKPASTRRVNPRKNQPSWNRT